jgi:hypothetical protein
MENIEHYVFKRLVMLTFKGSSQNVSFFQTKLVSFGRWVVFSCHVWEKKQNRTLRFVNKSLKMHLKNGLKLNGTSF